MIDYTKEVLSNGLSVVIHTDKSTPLVAVNILYKVGSKDEDPNKTGFTHLFEHLMFGGTKNVPDFDDVIQNAGGENNAFTNCDITNFYDIVPAENLEAILWLEADRMRNPYFTQKGLDIQKKVVIEEFKETCLNEPYGDLWHHLSAMAYKTHPYQWPTIGKEISHVEQANLNEVKDFFFNFYRPNNAVLVLSGNIDPVQGHNLVKKWFGDIPSAEVFRREILNESGPRQFKSKIIESQVPLTSLTLAFPMGNRLCNGYYQADLLTDVLGSGRSSRLYKSLIKEYAICVDADAFITGTVDPGLLIIEAKVNADRPVDEVRDIIWVEIDKVKKDALEDREIEKIKNKAESNLIFSETSTLNKAVSLAYYEYLGQLELINTEVDKYLEISSEDLLECANDILDKDKACELIYLPA